MKLLFFCPRWGMSSLSWDELCGRISGAGYHGIETDIPENAAELDSMQEALAKYGLLLIAQHWQTATVEAYERNLLYMSAAQPLFINSHTGRDFFSAKENERYLQAAAATPATVFHETHRGRFSFAAHITADFLARFPDLQLTLDVSHWINVSESYLADQQPALALAIARTRHIHARIGHQQGPQVNDPRLPEWEEALQAHLACWDEVVTVNRERGEEWLAITPEFGPPPYMPALSADQWEINLYMQSMLKNRYRL